MYWRDLEWRQYLIHRKATNPLIKAIDERSQDIIRGQAAQLAAQGVTEQTLERGFGQLIAGQALMAFVTANGFAAVTRELSQVNDSIQQLRADFQWGIGEISWRLEMQSATLQTIVTTLQAPLDTQAKELRRRAEEAYRNGWYDDALRDFLTAEQHNYQDFAVHQAIANIYLYQTTPPDLDQALTYYLKAGKYATPTSPYHAALGYMYAGFVAYLKRDDENAITYARRATELAPTFAEAWYNLAKFSAAANQPTIMVPAAERAIRLDRSYALKIRADADFDRLEDHLWTLMERLRAEARQATQDRYRTFQAEITRHTFRWGKSELTQCQETIAGLIQQDSYFSYLDADALLERFEQRYTVADALHGTLLGFVKCFRQGLETQLLCAGTTGTTAFYQNLTTGKWYKFNRSKPEFMSVDVAPNERFFAISSDKNIEIWDVHGGQQPVAVLKGHAAKILTCAFSPDGATLASADAVNDTLRLWDIPTWRQRAVMQGNTSQAFIRRIPGLLALAFSSDSSLVAAGGTDRTLRIWDVATGQLQVTLEGHTDWVYALAFSPDGALLASGGADKAVHLWDVRQRRLLHIFQGAKGDITTLAFSPDNRTLASGGLEPDISLWDVATGTLQSALKGDGNRVMGPALTFSVSGHALLSVGVDKKFRSWAITQSN